MNPMFRIAKFIIKIILVLFLWVLKESFYDQSLLPALYYTAVVKSILHFLIYWLTVNIIIRFAQFIYRKRKRMGDRYSDNVIGGLQNIYYILSVIGLLTVKVCSSMTVTSSRSSPVFSSINFTWSPVLNPCT